MMGAASAGAIVNKSPRATRELISTIAANSQRFGSLQDIPTRRVNEVNVSNLEKQISNLTSLVHQMAVGQVQPTRVC